ncbi:MAG: RNA methyltransferase [Bacteroidia bacterium]|nr:RNA methyltransferase [Bacteroidia bacterium]
MLSKNQIKYLNSLKQKKVRDELNLFIAEGAKIVPEIIGSSIVMKELYATPSFLAKQIKLPLNCSVTEISNSDLERISSLTTPNEVLAVCEQREHNLNSLTFKGKLTLLLDDIKDPGNLGTIVRIADWFGIETILCSSETVEVYNSKVIQATMGSIARVNVHYTNLLDLMQKNSTSTKLNVYGALLEGDSIYQQKLTSEGFIIIGNESHGISKELQSFVSTRITIPSFSHLLPTNEGAESLNAAIATAIICSEFRRNG